MIAILLSTLAFANPGQDATLDTDTDGIHTDPQGIDEPVGPAAIINGVDATIDDYPMTGGMLMDAFIDMGSYGQGYFRSFLCSSTLIAPDVVLLAGHCVDPDALTYGMGDVSDVTIMWSRQADLSEYDGSQRDHWPEDAVQAWDWVKNPDFDLNTMRTGLAENYDIALLFLDEPVLDAPYAYLPTPDEATQIAVDNPVTVVGWGQQTATSGYQEPPAGTYLYKQMGESFINELSDYEMQIGAEESDVRKCHGDSGGPSFMDVTTDSPEIMRIVGVTSHAYDQTDCATKGGVDTRVDAYLDWIDQEMRSRCDDGTRAWCEVPGIIPPPEPEPEAGDTGDGASGKDAKACGCSQAGSASSLAPWLLLGLVLPLARRRR